MMLLGLASLGIGMALAGLFPIYLMLAVGLFLGGLAKSLFDPALQAYIGERVTYQRRGMVIGLVEMSWAGAALVGIPLMGLLIDGWGWQAPFLVLSGLAMVSILAIALVIPTRRNTDSAVASTSTGFRQAWRTLAGSQAALGTLIYGFSMSMANDSIFVVYGAWLESTFSLGLVALGTATSVIGVAELSGETLVATLSDRIGPRRAVMGGAALTAVSYALLPLSGQTLPLALVGLFIAFVSFEFTIVTGFSVVTELLPAARGTMTASFLAVSSFGRMVGALSGGPLWLFGGMLWVGLAASVITAVGLLVFVWGLRNSTLR
jgi:predicted MFS family arabinose efflux permease